jgi:hypothetical protein
MTVRGGGYTTDILIGQCSTRALSAIVVVLLEKPYTIRRISLMG